MLLIDKITGGVPLRELRRPLLLWALCTLFFAFQFILRNAVGILRSDIMDRFQLDVLQFGSVVGWWYLGYSAMQIPMGYFLDRFPLRYVVSSAVMVTALGAFTFTFATDWYMILLGRVIIGVGSAAGFLSTSKVVKSLFPAHMHTTMLSLSFTFGLIGAVVSGVPTKHLFNNYGYEVTFNAIAGVAVLISLLILLIAGAVESKDQKRDVVSFSEILKLLMNPMVLFIGLCGGFMVGSLEGFADVWSIAFFEQVYGFEEGQSIFSTTMVYWGMCVGGPILAFCAKKMNSEVRVITITGILTCVIFGIFFSASYITPGITDIIMFILGILCCYQVLVFAFVSNIVDIKMAGTAIAVVNCLNMSFGYFFHKIIVILMHNIAGEAKVYTMPQYIQALGLIPLLSMVGAIGFWIISRKHKPAVS